MGFDTDFVKRLAERVDCEPKEAEEFVHALTETLVELFNEETKVTIAEFGTFEILPNKIVQFNPSAKLKARVG